MKRKTCLARDLEWVGVLGNSDHVSIVDEVICYCCNGAEAEIVAMLEEKGRNYYCQGSISSWVLDMTLRVAYLQQLMWLMPLS